MSDDLRRALQQTAPDSLARRVLCYAASQLGVMEDSEPNDDRLGAIRQYLDTSGTSTSRSYRDIINGQPTLTFQPWCAAYVSWVYQEAGSRLDQHGFEVSHGWYAG